MATLFAEADIVIICSDSDRLKHLQGRNYSEGMNETLGEIGMVRRILENNYLEVSLGVQRRYDYHPLAVTRVDLPCNGSDDEGLKIRKLLNKPNRNGSTVLHIAAHEGKIDVVRMLLDLGCDASGRDTYSVTQNALVLRDNTVDSHNEKLLISARKEGSGRANREITGGIDVTLKYIPGGPVDVGIQGSFRMDPEMLFACIPLFGDKFLFSRQRVMRLQNALTQLVD